MSKLILENDVFLFKRDHKYTKKYILSDPIIRNNLAHILGIKQRIKKETY